MVLVSMANEIRLGCKLAMVRSGIDSQPKQSLVIGHFENNLTKGQ